MIVTDHIQAMLAAANHYAAVAAGELDPTGCVEVETVDGVKQVPVVAVLEYAETLGQHAAMELADERLRHTWGFKAP